ncbi:hypothetical protein [Pseudomonas aeruginosa]|uniref:hypothetical protein n=1 Tax=Pseudomonas aeruginosa TaxID=287 RepID=UPI00131A0802|nr:hypothetical protein [Pseudomonas aeruginosa]MBV5595307.1 hypothetical protein [Pseudomonas aeruginosa]HBP4598774.1 hypothetical protein [Pseudomonas aeruginosa]
MNKKAEGVVNLYLFLEELTKDKELFKKYDIESILKTQGRMAKFSDEARGIKPCALNTLKIRSNKYIRGGFEKLEDARKSLLKRASNTHQTKPQKIIRTGPGSRELIQQIEKLKLNLMYLTIALEKSMAQSLRYAKASGDLTIVSLCKKEQMEIRRLISYKDKVDET